MLGSVGRARLSSFITMLALAAPLERARELYQKTEYEAALRVLAGEGGKDAAAYNLMGRCHYMLGDFKRAIQAFEQAAAAEPASSDHRLWLGRAWGRRAETSSFITAPGYASRARQHFEKAVEMNPRNAEALNDLFEYYLEAPGILGGGLDKAEALSQRIKELEPAEYHYAQARLAEKRRQLQAAERELRLAMQAAPKQAGRVVDLAKFLAKQGRWEEAESAFRQARDLAPDSPKVLFEQAAAYVRAGRNLPAARELLQRYLAAPLTPDDPPRREAEQLLKRAGS
jgi:tetratricopeptide (TPR) repeat protein